MNFSDTSYFLVPKDEECILTASGIGKKIDEPATTIRSWADKHGEYLYIKKINGRWNYTEASVEQFRFIKDLCRNKNFSHKQIEEHIKQHGFEFNKYDGGIVNPDNPLSYQALASALALENQKQLKQFLTEFIEYQNTRDNNRDEKLVEKINIEVEQTLIDKNDEQSKYIIDTNKEIVADLDRKIQQREEERDLKLVEKLRDDTKDAKIKALELEIEELKSNQHQGFFEKIFGKKK